MFRLVASVLVVLDRTFDDAEEVREFSPRYLAGFCEFRQASRRRGDTCSRFRCAFIIPSRASMCTALRSRERSCFLVVQTLWAEKIQSTTDAGSLNTFGRNEIEVAPISSEFLRIACLVILYKTLPCSGPRTRSRSGIRTGMGTRARLLNWALSYK